MSGRIGASAGIGVTPVVPTPPPPPPSIADDIGSQIIGGIEAKNPENSALIGISNAATGPYLIGNGPDGRPTPIDPN